MPATSDHDHLEQRLILLAELLDRAVAEVRQVTAEIQGGHPRTTKPPPPGPTGDTHA